MKTKFIAVSSIWVILGLILAFSTGCKKEEEPPPELPTLDGTWVSENWEVTIYGSSGTFTYIKPGSYWDNARTQHMVSLGSQKFKDITKIGDYLWHGKELYCWVDYDDVTALDTYWSTLTSFTLSPDGNTIFMYSETSYDGESYTDNYTITRKVN